MHSVARTLGVLVLGACLIACRDATSSIDFDRERYVHYRNSCAEARDKFSELLTSFKVLFESEAILPEPGVIAESNFDGLLSLKYSSHQDKLVDLALTTYKMQCGPNAVVTVPGLTLDDDSILKAVESSPIGKNHNGDFRLNVQRDSTNILVTKKNFSSR